MALVRSNLDYNGNKTFISTGATESKVVRVSLIVKIMASGLLSKILIWNSQRRSTSRFYVERDYNGNSKIGSKLNVVFYPVYFKGIDCR